MEKWDYTAGTVLNAIWQVGRSTGDARYTAYVRRNMDRFVQPDGSIRTYRVDDFSLDQVAQGRLLIPLWEATHDARYRHAADLLREQLRRQPRTAEGGFWHKQVYPRQMWLDGLYMAEPFYAGYARAFNEPAAFDDVTRQFLLLARHTRDPRTGLLYHGWDEARAQTWADPLHGTSPSLWGRAMGWYSMGLVDVLDVIPRSHPDRPELIRLLREFADAITRVQDPVTGMWYQVVDQPNRAGNYLESSSSAMFVYVLAKGVNRGWLDPRYLGSARRGFDGLVKHEVTVDADGRVSIHHMCKTAGLGRPDERDGSFEYYLREPVVSDDYKGVGPFILAALELGR
jgi:unsaturated rhamnogalacturonyl hydrolase